MKDYKRILQGVVNIINITKKSDIGFANICAYIGENCPEFKESEDERIKNQILYAIKQLSICKETKDKCIAWVEAQGEQQLNGTFINADDVREEFMQEVYRILDADSTNDRANQIIDAFDNLPSVVYSNQSEPTPADITDKLKKEYQKGWDAAMRQLPKGVDSQVWQIANNSAKTWEESFAILCATQKAYDKGKKDALKEQKTADKVEPKFHEGDWVIDKQGIAHQISNVIENVTNHTYGYDIVCGGYFNDKTEGVRLWTIQDAKDGDVLELDCGIGILKDKCIDGYNIHCYCYYSNEGVLEINKDSLYDTYQSHPATKEQRDALMKAITEAGYEWDADKKELKKIEQNPAWSEEDEEIYRKCICAMRASACGFPEEEKFVEQVDNWLKSLKERVQPKQEWSEEDEKILSDIITSMTNLKDSATSDALRNIYNSKIDWLKSLRPQNTWKPSEEQMDTLEYYMCTLICNHYKEILFSLYQDLKKLREE